MKKATALSLFFAGAVLCGCAGGEKAGGTEAGEEISGSRSENVSGEGNPTGTEKVGETGENVPGAGNLPGGGDMPGAGISENASETASGETQGAKAYKEASQGGPYGRLTISVPEGWAYEEWAYEEELADSGRVTNGDYGIVFYPEGVDEGYIEVSYASFFGVCGTGLETEERTIAGKSTTVGTYDNGEHWNFIIFHDEYEGVIATPFSVDGWRKEYVEQVFDILDTLSFEPDEREGSAYVYSRESEISEIGLLLSLKNISASGATLVWNWYDPEAATGELQCGDDFVLQQKSAGQWEEAPIVLEGNYGFHDIAYLLPAGETMEQELDWEWLYGQLAPGEYRIGKGVDDFRGSGDFDRYTIYAQFILN